MLSDTQIWIDAVLAALADARAMLACFGISERALEARIDAATDVAGSLKINAWAP